MIGATSLGARLLLGAVIWIAMALLGTGLVLSHLFRDQVVTQYDVELEAMLDQLTAALRLAGDGPQLATEPGDSRFHRPYGGRYWQVTTGARALRSRSLWDQVLPEIAPQPLGELQVRQLDLPGLGAVRVIARGVALATDRDRPLLVQVAMPLAEIDEVSARFDRLLALALCVLAVALLLAAIVQVTLGLRPLAAVRRDVARTRAGEIDRLPAEQPAEVAPLTGEINALLDANDAMVARARSQAGDLAHGLKTSLQLVELEATRLRQDGAAGAVDAIATEVARMRRHIDRQLARARARGQQQGRAEQTAIAAAVDGIVRTIRAVSAERRVTIAVDTDPRHRFAGSRGDLEELLGNLLDNAVKWARTRVRVGSTLAGDRLILLIDDDGPGLPADQRERALARGIRLDQRNSGSGLGLAITRDLVELYGGTMALEASPLGGLRARIELPGRAA